MNDQHPCLRAGDRVTLTDPVHFDQPLPLIITQMLWDPHRGEWYATATDAALTRTVFRSAGWFERGWPA